MEAVVSRRSSSSVRVDVVAQAPGQFDALLVHAGQHRAFGLALEFTDRRRCQAQQKMRSDLTHRRYPRPGKQNVPFKISKIAAHIPEEKKQPGNREPPRNDVPDHAHGTQVQLRGTRESQRKHDERQDHMVWSESPLGRQRHDPQRQHQHQRAERDFEQIEQLIARNRQAGGFAKRD
ncbi:MAG: hypothetical protein HYS65_03255 [Betaproteobacteria bacterium]|nr:hypothetical protein [Betaproteobacteria bacterium]